LYAIERQDEGRASGDIPIRQSRRQTILTPWSHGLNLSHDTLMHCGTCHALETSAIDALNGHPTRLCRPRQGHDPCIVATSHNINPLYTFGVTLEQSLHGVNAMHRL
jgi:hypothetical protein